MAEQTFLDSNGVIVTNSRFIVHGQTFAMSGITSVKAIKHIPSFTLLPGLFLLVGFFVLIGALFGISKGEQGAIGTLMFGLAITGGIGFYLYKNGQPTYQVILSTSGGEIKAFADKDIAVIQAIVAALNDAIVARG